MAASASNQTFAGQVSNKVPSAIGAIEYVISLPVDSDFDVNVYDVKTVINETNQELAAGRLKFESKADSILLLLVSCSSGADGFGLIALHSPCVAFVWDLRESQC